MLFGYGKCGVDRLPATRCEKLELELLDEQARTLAAQRRADEYHRSNVEKDKQIAELREQLRSALLAAQTPPTHGWTPKQRSYIDHLQDRVELLEAARDEIKAEKEFLEKSHKTAVGERDEAKAALWRAQETNVKLNNSLTKATLALGEELIGLPGGTQDYASLASRIRRLVGWWKTQRESIKELQDDIDAARKEAYAQWRRGNVYWERRRYEPPPAEAVNKLASGGCQPPFEEPEG